jgi:hemolysin activation/secretion protein
LSGSYVTYELGEEYKELDATGTAAVANAYLQYPIIRNTYQNLRARFDITHKHMRDKMGDLDYSLPKRATMGKLGLTYDKWYFPNGRNLYAAFELSATYGRFGIPDGDEKAANKRGADTVGNFAYANARGMVNYAFADDFSATFILSGQKALDNLDTGEQASISGEGAVRGYRSQTSGDNAYTATLEMRYALPSFAADFSNAVAIFGDIGRAYYHDASYTTENGDKISDAGVSYLANYRGFFGKVALTHILQRDGVGKEKDGDTHVLAQIGARF